VEAQKFGRPLGIHPKGPMTTPTNKYPCEYEKFRLKELLISGKVRDDSVICLAHCFKEPHFGTLNENVRKGLTLQMFWIVALLRCFNSWPFPKYQASVTMEHSKFGDQGIGFFKDL